MMNLTSALALVVVVIFFGSAVPSSPGEVKNDVAAKHEEDAEERALVTKVLFKVLAKKAAKKSFSLGLEALAEEARDQILDKVKINFNQKPSAVLRDVGKSILGVLKFGLSLSPLGFISGVFTGVWSVVSSLFGGGRNEEAEAKQREEEQRMKVFQDMINEAMEKTMRITMAKTLEKVDGMLTDILSGSITAELRRNKYVCDKYAYVSKKFADDLKKTGKPLAHLDRVEFVSFLENCDNFLKDTSEAFVYPKYSRALWIPSVITTVARTSFLTEVINYSPLLHIPDFFVVNYYRELKNDIRRHLELFADGFKPPSDVRNWRLFPEQVEACRLQSQLLYLDRDVYPYGIPKLMFVLDAASTEDSLTAQKKPLELPHDKASVKHIYITTYVPYDPDDIGSMFYVNCYTSPFVILRAAYKFEFGVRFHTNRSYEIRMVYINLNNRKPVKAVIKTISPGYDVRVEVVEDFDVKETGVPVFEVAATFMQGGCPEDKMGDNGEGYELTCDNPLGYEQSGKFTIDSAGAVNVLAENGEKEVTGAILVKEPYPSILLGVEMIFHQVM